MAASGSAVSSSISVVTTQAKPEDVAKALLAELEWPVPMEDHIKRSLTIPDESKKNKGCFYDKEPPTRKELGWQEREGVDAAKAKLKAEMGDCGTDDMFCPVHGDFAVTAGSDVDHASSFEEMRVRQEAFLNFLNSNPVFANAFLSFSGGGKDKIADFFKRDPEPNGKIRGTRYFYRMCYNNFNNLWSICHGCNIQKGSADFLSWSSEQKFFGNEFVKAVEGKDGVKPGIICNRVGGVSIGELPIGKGGAAYEVITGGTGLGEFARDWLHEKHGKTLEVHRSFRQVVFSSFRSWLDTRLQNISASSRRRLQDQRYLAMTNRVYQKTLEVKRGSYTHTSQSDSDSMKESTAKVNAESTADREGVKHYLKELRDFLVRKYSAEKSEIEVFFNELIEKKYNPVAGVSEDEAKKFRDDFKDKIERLPSAANLPSWASLKQNLEAAAEKLGTLSKTALRATAAESQVERERNRADTAEGRAEQEKREKLAERERAAELERKNKELQAQLEALSLSEERDARRRKEPRVQSATDPSMASSSSGSLAKSFSALSGTLSALNASGTDVSVPHDVDHEDGRELLPQAKRTANKPRDKDEMDIDHPDGLDRGNSSDNSSTVSEDGSESRAKKNREF